MIVKLENYNGKYKIVSLALSQAVKKDLLKDSLDFIYVSDNDIRLYPEDVQISRDKNIIRKFEAAHNYDVYELWENGRLSEYYDDSSLDNYFFVTGKCNSNCVMCPSPDISRQKGGNTSVNTLIEIAKHIPTDAPHLTITGGEPFMVGQEIFRFFEFLRDKFECTDFLLLTNGRIFAVDSYVQRFAEKAPKNSIVAIPIHGSTANIHDMITQSKGSFNQTKIGIKKLLKVGIHVELRIVVSRLNKDDMSCIYCQANNGVECSHLIMNKEMAEKAVDIALQSPEQSLCFEFQGGEPLVNFEIIKHIVQYAEIHKENHEIAYTVVTNLTLLNEEMLDFFVQYSFGISTSVDGSELVHNNNRP